MKTLFISVLIVVLFVFKGYSQNYRLYGIIHYETKLPQSFDEIFGEYDKYNISKENKKKVIDKKIKTITHNNYRYKIKNNSEEYKGKGIYNFDSRGNLLNNTYYNEDSIITFKVEFQYNDSDKYTLIDWIKKNNKSKFKETLKYNPEGKLIEDILYGKRGKILDKSTKEYNSKNQIISSSFYKKGGVKLRWRDECVYNEDGSRNKTLYYNRKGKLKHVYIFDCNPIGEHVKSLKDSSRVCKKYETDSAGNKVEIIITTVKKGKLQRTITVYDKKDRILDYKNYNIRDKITWGYLRRYDKHDNKIESAYYKRNGKLKYHNASKYDDNNNLIEYLSYKKGDKNIKKYRSTNKYDSKNNMIETIHYKKGGIDISSKHLYSYNENNQLTNHTCNFGKNLKQSNSTDFKYGNKSLPIEVKHTGEKKSKRNRITKLSYEFY